MADNSYLPQTGDDLDLIEFAMEQQPSCTYNLDVGGNQIQGKIDGVSALRQAIYLILGTERYAYLIYSWNYGAEFSELIGQPKDYVLSEIKRHITEALLQDDRITSVDSFEFECKKNTVHVIFTVRSIFGVLEVTTDVRR